MTINNVWKQAFELSLADAQAERALDDIGVLNVLRGSILVRTVMYLEAARANSGSTEQDALRAMRNAIVHNSFDLAKNTSPRRSHEIVGQYLSELRNSEVPSATGGSLPEFFSLRGTVVTFDRRGVHEACRQILMKYI